MLNKTIKYTRDHFRNLFFFYTEVDGVRVSLGRLHVRPGTEPDTEQLTRVFDSYHKVVPRTLNVHISDLVNSKGQLLHLKVVQCGREKQWVYTYANGKKKTVRYDPRRRHSDARYFIELIRARFQLGDSITAIVVEHICQHM